MAIHGIPIEKEFTRTSAPILSVSVVQDRKTELTCALVDSGCEGYAFIDREYAKSVGLALRAVSRPFSRCGYDGEERDSCTMREYVRCDNVEECPFTRTDTPRAQPTSTYTTTFDRQ